MRNIYVDPIKGLDVDNDGTDSRCPRQSMPPLREGDVCWTFDCSFISERPKFVPPSATEVRLSALERQLASIIDRLKVMVPLRRERILVLSRKFRSAAECQEMESLIEQEFKQ